MNKKVNTSVYLRQLAQLISTPEINASIKEEFKDINTLKDFLETTFSVRVTLTSDDSYLVITVNKHSGYAFVTLPCNKLRLDTSTVPYCARILGLVAQYNDLIKQINEYSDQ